ncbi:Tn3 family transposase [Bacillus toyonensis]
MADSSRKAIELLSSKHDVNEELLKHISLLGWEHINFLGEYRFSLKGVTTLDKLKNWRLFCRNLLSVYFR